jgi:hypothetical protein
MQAIEFTYESRDGMISIPKQYKDWFKKSFKHLVGNRINRAHFITRQHK